jgi:hypothetical protein
VPKPKRNLPFRMVYLATVCVVLLGCNEPTALELINLYECQTCKPDECTLTYHDGHTEPCGEGQVCCKYDVPEQYRYIIEDCRYEPLWN